MADEIASQMKIRAMPFPLPLAFLWQLCLAREIISRFTGKANILSLQKFAELKAPGWVCDASLLRQEIGCECRTTLKAGIAGTLSWYRKEGWL
jgi:nucleoside-diphosphate-sugar epimerase